MLKSLTNRSLVCCRFSSWIINQHLYERFTSVQFPGGSGWYLHFAAGAFLNLWITRPDGFTIPSVVFWLPCRHRFQLNRNGFEYYLHQGVFINQFLQRFSQSSFLFTACEPSDDSEKAPLFCQWKYSSYHWVIVKQNQIEFTVFSLAQLFSFFSDFSIQIVRWDLFNFIYLFLCCQ
jgi:hypothetical protein